MRYFILSEFGDDYRRIRGKIIVAQLVTKRCTGIAGPQVRFLPGGLFMVGFFATAPGLVEINVKIYTRNFHFEIPVQLPFLLSVCFLVQVMFQGSDRRCKKNG